MKNKNNNKLFLRLNLDKISSIDVHNLKQLNEGVKGNRSMACPPITNTCRTYCGCF
ncbi:MAG: hypothetical protein ACEPOW_01865 [Bacteroidales bacterium]